MSADAAESEKLTASAGDAESEKLTASGGDAESKKLTVSAGDAESERDAKRPLVSVVVPVYNGERYLAAALQSIVDQDYRPIEMIVVDDGSVDGSAAVARSFGDVVYIHQSNQGVATARNAGIAAARGDLLAFLDADDLWLPRKLSTQVGCLLERPEAGYVLAKLHNFLEPGIRRPFWIVEEHLQDDLIHQSPCTLVVRRSVFAQIGVFDPRFRTSEDTEWFMRARDAGIPVVMLPDVFVHRRIHGANISAVTKSVRSHLQILILKESLDRRRGRAAGGNFAG